METHILLLTGAPGVGKTSLIRYVLDQLITKGGRVDYLIKQFSEYHVFGFYTAELRKPVTRTDWGNSQKNKRLNPSSNRYQPRQGFNAHIFSSHPILLNAEGMVNVPQEIRRKKCFCFFETVPILLAHIEESCVQNLGKSLESRNLTQPTANIVAKTLLRVGKYFVNLSTMSVLTNKVLKTAFQLLSFHSLSTLLDQRNVQDQKGVEPQVLPRITFFFFLDEIGKMEVAYPPFRDMLLKLFDFVEGLDKPSSVLTNEHDCFCMVATVSQRGDPFIEELKKRQGFGNIWEITWMNRESRKRDLWNWCSNFIKK